MTVPFKGALRYVIILGVTFLLVWLSIRFSGVNGNNLLENLSDTWSSIDKGWLWAMVPIALLSHIVRAERWRMLLSAAGNKVSLVQALISLMVGYIVNLAIPRGGEVSRCYNLLKLSRCPVEVSLGTVITERIIDVISLLIVLVLAVSIETEKMVEFVQQFSFNSISLESVVIPLAILIGLVVGVWLIVRFFRRNQKFKDKTERMIAGFKGGLISAKNVKNKPLFIFYSVAIWILYYLMSYSVLLAFSETRHMGPAAVLLVFAVGCIAMAVPLPGGTGSYHALVPACLVLLFGIPKTPALTFTFIFHGWQTIIMIVFGAVSFILTAILVHRNSRKPTEEPL